MYKLLIVDDEEPLKEAIKLLGDWEKHLISQIIEAENGKEGLKAVREHRPDIVIVDMRMPELEGPEFLQYAETECPELISIVVSGYNDFKYMRQAVKSNTIDYLQKPVMEPELNQALATAVARLDERRKKKVVSTEQNMAINMSLPMLKQHTYYSLIKKNFNPQIVKARMAYFNPGYEQMNWQMALLRILNLNTIAASRFNREMDLLHFAVTNIMNEPNERGTVCFSFANPQKPNEIMIVLSLNGHCSEAQVTSIIKGLIKRLNELIGVVAIAAIGSVCTDVFALGESYRVSEQIMDTVNIWNRKESVFARPSEKEKTKIYTLAAKTQLLRHAFERESAEFCRSVIKDFIKPIDDYGYLGLGNANRIKDELELLLHDIALESGVPSESLLRIAGETVEFKDAMEFESSLLQIADSIGKLIAMSSQLNKAFDINELKIYIDRYYFQDIKIKTFTDKYFLSREYLMKLFKKEIGFGIYEYVQKVRMEKAKELLSDPTLKIQSIAELLGYSNSHYFSKAFKNYYRLSPSEHRALQAEHRAE
ncbi:response regulator [Cohnella terricola]|uniref:Response regulator n=1 Tax=Cohnella terricola TaxID=1289167 RepID=A0A559JWJ8_9BACL|nr:response regulator [Cohnella terricola]TVY04263.1 response regulator [Cohnella terricola]